MTVNRRRFLGYSAGAGVAATGLLVPWHSVAIAAEKTQNDFEDYKALVYLLFSGGMDSFNLLVPLDDDEYGQYADIRSDLKFEQSDLLELDNSNTSRRFSVPSYAQELRDLFNDGNLAFLANVGPLVKHMNREQFLDALNGEKPLNLESHSDQIAQWQTTDTSTPLAQQTVGWLGRVSDRFGSTLNNGLSMNVSVSGLNLVQTGSSGTQVLTPNLDGESAFSLPVENYVDVKTTANEDFEFGRFDNRYENLLQKEYLKRFKRSIEDARKADRDFRAGSEGFDNFSREGEGVTHFAAAMRRIAQMISAHLDFGGGVKRQTFYVEFGGWDHHEQLHDNFEWRMRDVSFVLKAFRDALVEIDMLDNVVLFTASDFGRTLTSNGGGSDHGWGGNAMILGGEVSGKDVLGEFPDMNLDGEQISNENRGNFIPTTSLEEYYSELALWFGLDEEDLELALPNVSSFIPEGATKPESVGIFESDTDA